MAFCFLDLDCLTRQQNSIAFREHTRRPQKHQALAHSNRYMLRLAHTNNEQLETKSLQIKPALEGLSFIFYFKLALASLEGEIGAFAHLTAYSKQDRSKRYIDSLALGFYREKGCTNQTESHKYNTPNVKRKEHFSHLSLDRTSFVNYS